MQEWLKDKKNLPIVAAIGALVLIGAVVLILFETGILPPQPAPTPQGSSNTATALPGALPSGAPQPPMAPGGVPPGGAPPSAGPGQTASAAAGAKTPAAPLNAAKGPDPFRVPGYHPFRVSQAAVDALRVRNALPPVFIQQYQSKDQLLLRTKGERQAINPLATTAEVSSSMRMSGVITSDNSIKALLENNGVSTQVQPGDMVDGGKVLSIQADGLTLRTSDNRLVRVPLSGTLTGGNSPYSGGGSPGNGDPGLLPPGADLPLPPQ